MRKSTKFCMAIASLFSLAVPGHVSAGGVLFRDHTNFTETGVATNFCGIEGTSVVKVVDNFTVYSNDTFKDNFTITETFTSVTGKSIVLHVAQQVTGDAPIDNGDGTVSFVNTYKGLPEQIRVKNGPLLSRDAGTVTFVDTFAIDPVTGDFTFVSQTLSGLHGPHPDLLSDFAIFCDVIVPALS